MPLSPVVQVKMFEAATRGDLETIVNQFLATLNPQNFLTAASSAVWAGGWEGGWRYLAMITYKG